MKLVIGIDPDSSKHGVAVYVDGKLEHLLSVDLLFIYGEFIEPNYKHNDIEFHIEDVNGVSAAFGARDNSHNIHVKLKMAQSIGKCKQAQIELERFIEFYKIKVVKHKISKMWKKDKAMFERITGWEGRSNEDTRSAAYFGYLGLNK